MLNNNHFFKEQQAVSADVFLDGQQQMPTTSSIQIRKPYYKPQLELFGDLRALTFGSFDGAMDSGGMTSWDPGEIP